MNRMNDKQDELVTMLMEECGEVVTIASKAKRHGLNSYNPYDPMRTENRVLLKGEVIDVLAMISYLEDEGIIDSISNDEIQKTKEKKLRWMHFMDSPKEAD